MRALVTGVAGFIGSNVARRVLAHGWEVVGIDALLHEEGIEFSARNLDELQALGEQRFVFYKRDVSEFEEMQRIFELHKPEIVFHQAALPRVQYSIKEPFKTHASNDVGTHNLLFLSKEHGARRFVFASSSSVYGDSQRLPLREGEEQQPISPYAAHKLVGEIYCGVFHACYGLETIALRYFNVYGPEQNPCGAYAQAIPKFAKLILEGKQPTIYGDGEQTRDFTYIDDVVEANMLAATTQNAECFGKAFNIGSGKNYSVNEIFRRIARFYNSDIEPIYAEPVQEPRHTQADITRARELLGWTPKVTLDEGLPLTLEYFRKIFQPNQGAR
ncbi:NAD-dependent epimerase/dehydratase family protein [Candidatus Pacearchaeota archaeon]|nr:MAG: NAD-dependent epimerase/dehydratase family protein [Candidatus Pacearchaeota archaeon]